MGDQAIGEGTPAADRGQSYTVERRLDGERLAGGHRHRRLEDDLRPPAPRGHRRAVQANGSLAHRAEPQASESDFAPQRSEGRPVAVPVAVLLERSPPRPRREEATEAVRV